MLDTHFNDEPAETQNKNIHASGNEKTNLVLVEKHQYVEVVVGNMIL